MFALLESKPPQWVVEFVANLYCDAYESISDLGEVMAGMFRSDGEGLGAISIAEKAVNDIVGGMTGAMSGIGMAIAILFFLIALLELSTTERLTLEFFIKFFSKLVIAIALICLCPTLVSKIGDFASSLAAAFGGAEVGATPVNKEEFIEWVAQEGTGSKWIPMLINGILTAGVMGIVSMALLVLTYVVAFSRVLEMGVRGCFLPIAIGMMSDDGWRGAGGRYIRKYVAICCQSSVIVVIGRVTNAIFAKMSLTVLMQSDGYNLGLFGSMIMMLGIGIASVMLLFKSIGIVNDAFGG